jgi:hypothetical protein
MKLAAVTMALAAAGLKFGISVMPIRPVTSLCRFQILESCLRGSRLHGATFGRASDQPIQRMAWSVTSARSAQTPNTRTWAAVVRPTYRAQARRRSPTSCTFAPKQKSSFARE